VLKKSAGLIQQELSESTEDSLKSINATKTKFILPLQLQLLHYKLQKNKLCCWEFI
jgi:hypothetical protein